MNKMWGHKRWTEEQSPVCLRMWRVHSLSVRRLHATVKEKPRASWVHHAAQWRVGQGLKASQKPSHLCDFLGRSLGRQTPREQLLPRLERTGPGTTFHANQAREMICLVTLPKKNTCVLKILRSHGFVEDRNVRKTYFVSGFLIRFFQPTRWGKIKHLQIALFLFKTKGFKTLLFNKFYNSFV